ncbi:hypothetical protein ACJ72_07795 [Emergomyces africanus]|uniref:SH3 domain-containing protein n=1 Tax=Emergomyces africanus TaxID=1955775 RepID=A0A1B7NM38_9EURO|nr:hypothetical protein ACJ72_07795 [Emergomyces africanus]
MPHQHGHNAAHIREMAKRQRRPEPDIVFVTVPPDFEGPIGGFLTEGAPGVGSPVRPTRQPHRPRPTRRPTSPSPRPTPSPKRPTTEQAKPTNRSPQSRKPSQASTTLATSPSDSPLESPNSRTGFNELRQTGTGSPTAIPQSSGSGGMSGGAKAGLAIGIILLVGLIAGAALFFIRKKKRDQSELTGFDNEKPFGSAVSSGSGPGPTVGSSDPPPMTRTLTSPTAPQLNIRPITQFSPDFAPTPATPGNAFSGGLAPGSAAAGAARNLTGGGGPTPPPKMSNNDPNPFNDPVNPFDSPAVAPAPATLATPGTPATPASGAPHSHMPSPAVSDTRTPSPETLGTGVAAMGTAIAAGAVGAVAVRRSLNNGKPQELPRDGPGPARDAPPPGSPAISMDSATAAAVAGAGAGAGGAAGPPNVHRVQLDFTPSMEDELELRAGQLVRLVHEYDDGWALCVRLDRSSQGVVPRTCLSARPVRPRPRNQSNAQGGPGPRGPPSMGPHGGPPSDGGRSMSMSSQMSHHSPNPSGPPQPRFQPPANGRPASPASPAPSSYRTFPPQQQHPHPHHPHHHQHHQKGRSMSPARFPQVPRSLSPGPGRIPQPRSMSPGPYGPGGVNRPPMSASANRRRSHSTSAAMGHGNINNNYNNNNNNHVPSAPQGQGQGQAQGQGQGQQQFALPSASTGFGGYPGQSSSGVPAQAMAQQHQPQPQPQQPQVPVQVQAQAPQVQTPMPAQATPKPSRSPPMPTGPIERKPVPGQAQQ